MAKDKPKSTGSTTSQGYAPKAGPKSQHGKRTGGVALRQEGDDLLTAMAQRRIAHALLGNVTKRVAGDPKAKDWSDDQRKAALDYAAWVLDIVSEEPIVEEEVMKRMRFQIFSACRFKHVPLGTFGFQAESWYRSILNKLTTTGLARRKQPAHAAKPAAPETPAATGQASTAAAAELDPLVTVTKLLFDKFGDELASIMRHSSIEDSTPAHEGLIAYGWSLVYGDGAEPDTLCPDMLLKIRRAFVRLCIQHIVGKPLPGQQTDWYDQLFTSLWYEMYPQLAEQASTSAA